MPKKSACYYYYLTIHTADCVLLDIVGACADRFNDVWLQAQSADVTSLYSVTVIPGRLFLIRPAVRLVLTERHENKSVCDWPILRTMRRNAYTRIHKLIAGRMRSTNV